MTGRLSALVLVLALAVGAGAFWFHRSARTPSQAGPSADELAVENDWLQNLHSQNPRIAEDAAARVTSLGAAALPDVLAALRDPGADAATKKAALKACGILGPIAKPAVNDVAAHLQSRITRRKRRSRSASWGARPFRRCVTL